MEKNNLEKRYAIKFYFKLGKALPISTKIFRKLLIIIVSIICSVI
jgi:hypothetical protein